MVPLLVGGKARQGMDGAVDGGGGGGGDGGGGGTRGGGGLLLPGEGDGVLAFCSVPELYARMRPLLLALQEHWAGFSCALVLQLLEGLLSSHYSEGGVVAEDESGHARVCSLRQAWIELILSREWLCEWLPPPGSSGATKAGVIESAGGGGGSSSGGAEAHVGGTANTSSLGFFAHPDGSGAIDLLTVPRARWTSAQRKFMAAPADQVILVTF